MKLNIVPRSTEKKRETKRLLRNGSIPAILYSQGKEGEPLTVAEDAFSAVLRSIVKGRLPTTIFILVDEKGKERKAIVKDIQYHPTTYQIIHLDFEELIDGEKVMLKVPIECIGVMDCAGIKLGGVLRQVIRHVRVECLPKDIPTAFELDVRELGLRQYKKLSDLAIPSTLRPRANMNEVAVVIAKR